MKAIIDMYCHIYEHAYVPGTYIMIYLFPIHAYLFEQNKY